MFLSCSRVSWRRAGRRLGPGACFSSATGEDRWQWEDQFVSLWSDGHGPPGTRWTHTHIWNTHTHREVGFFKICSFVRSATLLPFVSQLEELDLSWNELIGGSLRAMTSHMNYTNSISSLKLSGCRLNPDDITALGGAQTSQNTSMYMFPWIVWSLFLYVLYQKRTKKSLLQFWRCSDKVKTSKHCITV